MGTMLYGDLRSAVNVYNEGGNVTDHLKKKFGLEKNSIEVIETAYDLQAGSYIRNAISNKDWWREYTQKISEILSKHVAPGESVLDIGTGEMTTWSGVANNCFSDASSLYACDISWSRIDAGLEFAEKEVEAKIFQKLNFIVADFFSLPFVDKSIDVVWSTHALEPNGGREEEALHEIIRVAKNKIILFEPCYEENSDKGKARMDRLGYVKNIAKAIKECGETCDEIIPLKSVSNPLNPTYAFIITLSSKNSTTAEHKECFACPATKYPMRRFSGHFFCEYSLFAYPIINDIPVLRPDAAILASGLMRKKV